MEPVWSSLFDWIKTQDRIDSNRIVAWGFSTGGHYAIRVAHTYKDKLLGTVALGEGAHHITCLILGGLTSRMIWNNHLSKFLLHTHEFGMLVADIVNTVHLV